MMRRFLRAALLGVFLLPAAAAAQDRPVVVELFTSQGCSSCPPADALMGELSSQDDVIGLALHVDYWDYIGWKDEFADPAFTKRQRGYAYAANGSTIFTPQMIVGGRDHVVGHKPMKLAKLIERHSETPQAADVTLTRNGDLVTVRVEARGRIPAGSVVQLATYTPKQTVKIERGENRGRTLTYHNIVRDLDVVGEWSGRGTFTATARVTRNAPVVAIVQEPMYGPILGAARLR